MSRQALFNLALKAFLLLSPVFLFKGYRPSFARGMFFIFASFALFGISLASEPKRRFSNPWVALFLLWAFIRMLARENFGDPASEWINFWLSSAGFIYVLAGVLLFYTVYCHAEDPKSYLKPILIVCIMNFALVVAQLTGHDFMWTNAPSLCGFFGVSPQLGQYSAMSLILLSPWFLPLAIFTLFASKSISSILAVFAGLTFLSWQMQMKKYIIPIIIVAIAVGLYNYKEILSKWSCRPVMWKRTLKAALLKPYIGGGYGSFTKTVVHPDAAGSIGDLEFSRAHNDPLHNSQEFGFPIMIIAGGFFVDLWRKFKAKQNKDKLTYFLAASILIVLFNSCGQTLFRYASISGTFIVLLAFLKIKLEGEENATGNHI